MPLSNWALGGMACFLWLMLHLRYVPINYNGTLRGFWLDGSHRVLISKLLFGGAILASLAIGIAPVAGIVLSVIFFIGHGLTMLRK